MRTTAAKRSFSVCGMSTRAHAEATTLAINSASSSESSSPSLNCGTSAPTLGCIGAINAATLGVQHLASSALTAAESELQHPDHSSPCHSQSRMPTNGLSTSTRVPAASGEDANQPRPLPGVSRRSIFDDKTNCGWQVVEVVVAASPRTTASRADLSPPWTRKGKAALVACMVKPAAQSPGFVISSRASMSDVMSKAAGTSSVTDPQAFS
mmetsp:Transcript_59726/g.158965  ORF Transcript_59726/g.158965 Transcript_59726/m.158965 type:complete len:210 (+) Transcript_59726:1074-1703(+)